MSFNRRHFLRAAGLIPASLVGFRSYADVPRPGLPRATPGSQGVSSEAILAFLDEMAKGEFELHSFMMLRQGQVIAEGWWEPYGPEFVHSMYSLSKSFTSTAVGFAVAEGKLSVQDKVISFFPDDLPTKVSDHLAALRVQDLLTMSVGSAKEPTQTMVKSDNWVRTFLAHEIAHQPGTQFLYNSAATYMCSAIVQKVTGLRVVDYLTPRLFQPLGIAGMRWEICPKGINTGGWGLSIQTEGLAKFGQLYLQKGMWNGKQLLPTAWVDEATSFHIQQPGDDKPDRPKTQNDWLQGYGYQFWRCQHGGFRGDGAFGQFTVVLPEQDVVVVMTGENKNMQGELDLVWKHLLPGIGKPTPAKDGALAARLSSLVLAPPEGVAIPTLASQISGKMIALEKNAAGLDSLKFTFANGQCLFEARAGKTLHSIACGMGTWKKGQMAFPDTPPRLISGGKPKPGTTSEVAATARWVNSNTLEMIWRYFETPHHDTVTVEFGTESVRATLLNSITGMNPKAKDPRSPLSGKLVF